MLQTRTGKRTAKAAVKIAVDMVNEGLIDEKTAVLRVEPAHVITSYSIHYTKLYEAIPVSLTIPIGVSSRCIPTRNNFV